MRTQRYPIKMQKALQSELGPQLRALAVKLIEYNYANEDGGIVDKATSAARQNYLKDLRKNGHSVDTNVITTLAEALDLSISLKKIRRSLLTLFCFHGRATIQPINPKTDTAPDFTAHMTEYAPTNGAHYHLYKDELTGPTFGGGNCGFNLFAQVFDLWEDKASLVLANSNPSVNSAQKTALRDDLIEMFTNLKESGQSVIAGNLSEKQKDRLKKIETDAAAPPIFHMGR